MGVQILGEQVVLFRDRQGQVQCLGDVCPHRGAPLHRGWVAEADGQDCIVCPYHGWVGACRACRAALGSAATPDAATAGRQGRGLQVSCMTRVGVTTARKLQHHAPDDPAVSGQL